MTERHRRLRGLIEEEGAAAALLTLPADIRWATGFSGSNGLVVVRADSVHFLTDGRYGEQAAEEVKDAGIHVPGYDLVGGVIERELIRRDERILISTDSISVEELDELRERLPEVEWVKRPALLRTLRGSKDEAEIQEITRAQQLTEEAVEAVLPRIREGVTEGEIAAELVYEHLRRGAGAMSFDPIVAFGERSALPHARASERRLRRGEVVLIDVGGYLNGYASDMTRIFALGEPGEEVREIYAAVLEAQEIGIQAVRAGMSGKEVDARARRSLEEKGLADRFTHGLGHGVGLDVHEWPRLSYTVDSVLPENAVVSVEPGVYLPGRFGIRIEDLVVARVDGPEVITRMSKELRVL